MNNTLIHITAQVSENYGTPQAPCWKLKGGQVFSLNVDSDAFMYVEDACIKAIKTLLAKRSNAMCVYEYVCHELIFMGIEQLNDKEFAEEVQKNCEKDNKPT